MDFSRLLILDSILIWSFSTNIPSFISIDNIMAYQISNSNSHGITFIIDLICLFVNISF